MTIGPHDAHPIEERIEAPEISQPRATMEDISDPENSFVGRRDPLMVREAAVGGAPAGRVSSLECAGVLAATVVLAVVLGWRGGDKFDAAVSGVAQLVAALVGATACLVGLRRLSTVSGTSSTTPKHAESANENASVGDARNESERGLEAVRADAEAHDLARASWPWRLVALSLGCFVLAHAMSQGSFAQAPVPADWQSGLGPTGIEQFCWTAQYPLLWLALLLLAWLPSPGTPAGPVEASVEPGAQAGKDAPHGARQTLTRVVIDRLIVVMAVLVVFWKMFLEQRFASGASEVLPLKSLVAFFPASLAGHLFTALMLAAAPRHRLGSRTLAFLYGALLLLLITDSAYAFQTTDNIYRAGSVLDSGWVGAWMLLGVAALDHSDHIALRRRATSTSAASASAPNAAAVAAVASATASSATTRVPWLDWAQWKGWSRWRAAAEVWLPYGAALGACAILVAREAASESPALGSIAPILALVAVVVARQMMTFSDNMELSNSLRRANRDLERHVRDRTRHLSTLHAISSTLNSSLDDRAILRGTLDSLLVAVHADAGGIWLRDSHRFASDRAPLPRIHREPASDSTRDDASTSGASSPGWGEGAPAYTVGFGDDLLSAINLRDRAFITAITSGRMGFNSARRIAGPGEAEDLLPGEGGLIMLPILWQGLLLGAIGLLRREGAFSREERALVESVALEAGTALQNARLYQEATRRADRDPVTELLNHRAVQQSLHSWVLKSRVAEENFAVVMMDMNNFKFFNDTYGHLAGDDVLRAVARALQDGCRASDVVGRYGGDEFVAILPATNAEGARQACGRIASELDRHHFEAEPDSRVPIEMSFGWAVFPHDGETPLELTTHADARLYESKRGGANSFLWSLPYWSQRREDLRAPSPARRGRNLVPNNTSNGTAPGASTCENAEEREEALDEAEVLASVFGGSFDVLDSLVTAIDNKDRYTRRHSEEVTHLALLTGREMGLDIEMLRAVRLTGLLHDVGKIAVPDSILRHPGRLGEEEVRIMKRHPVFGALIIRDIAHQEAVVSGVRHHHERWDGRGYPDGLRGTDIPWTGRLLAVADVFSALTTDRPYRKALGAFEAIAEIENGAGTLFDPSFTAPFARALRREIARASDLQVLAPNTDDVMGTAST